jgi:spore coat protein CotF
MNDQAIMENLLLTTKGVADLYLHGAIESATPNVHQAFSSALNSTLCMQDQVYQKMSAKGWYTATPAQQQQIDQVRAKFSN